VDFVAVIMAGGSGQRFWPLSTSDRPKQFLDLERCGHTLLQSTFRRVLPLAKSPEHVLVATAARYLELVREQLPELPRENILLEPTGRDSAPAIALASLAIAARYGNPLCGFFSSDHRVGDEAAFLKTLRAAIELTHRADGLTTIGIKPTHPATGYGYIQAGEVAFDGCSGYRVARFVEKPDKMHAQAYCDAGDYSWNGGIFIWHAQTILNELELHAPELLRPLRRAFAEGRVGEVFSSLKKISIDYAVLEHTDKAYVVPGDFDWDDIGDWMALERLLEGDGVNTVIGKHIGLEASGNIIYTEDAEDVVVTLGVNNLVVVKRGNTVLLLDKARVQDLKKLLADERLLELK
jgi:mannose-1-phosphate guanylyltransferase